MPLQWFNYYGWYTKERLEVSKASEFMIDTAKNVRINGAGRRCGYGEVQEIKYMAVFGCPNTSMPPLGT
jgi:hypothetical protein